MDAIDSWIIVMTFAIFLIMIFVLTFFVYDYADKENVIDHDKKQNTKKNTIGEMSEPKINSDNIEHFTTNNFYEPHNLNNKPTLFDDQYETLLTGKPDLSYLHN